MANWTLFEYEGKVAITLGWATDIDGPKETRPIWHHPTEKWDKHSHGQYSIITIQENNVFSCFNYYTNQHQMLYTHDWIYLNETRDIPPPGRGGKTWKWRWSKYFSKWQKESI